MCHIAILDKLFCHRIRGIDRYGKPQPFGYRTSPAIADDQGIDADHFACQVHQRTTRVALVDGRVGLDQALDLVTVASVDRTPCGTDDTSVTVFLKSPNGDPMARTVSPDFKHIRVTQVATAGTFPSVFSTARSEY